MHIAILAPSDKTFISAFLPNISRHDLPDGYFGAPFIGILIDELLKNNHSVTAITTTKSINDDYTIKEFSNDKFTWIVVPSRPNSMKFNGKKLGRIIDFFALEQNGIIQTLKNIKPDIVHAHWSYEFAGASIKSGFPYLVTVHDNAFQVFGYFKNTYRFLRLLMAERYLKRVKYASTVSPYMCSYVIKKCKSVKLIPNPTLIRNTKDEIKKLIDDKIRNIKSPVIFMINNGWDLRKNGKNGLLAFKVLQNIFPNASLHLFGNGSEINGLAYMDAQKIGIENIFFNGPVSHQVLLESLQKAHLLLHPALEESFGVVLIEAMSFGIPAIGGFKSGAVPWVINEEKLLVDVTDPELMKSKMLAILSNVDNYTKLANDAYSNVVNRFSSEAVVNYYLSYYQTVLENNKI